MTDTPPLAGIRVLDFTQNLPGPYATALLSSLGAEVLKVEPLRGETARSVPRFFELVNAGKKSVAVDLKDPKARASIRALALEVDVVIEGFRPGVMESFGLDAISLRRERPSLVYCSMSAYGQEGVYRARPAHDLNLQALTGACDLGADASGKPLGGALPVADLSSSMTAALAIVAALYSRQKSGEGSTIDVALADTIASWVHVWGEGLTPASLPLRGAAVALARSLERTSSPGAFASLTRVLKSDSFGSAADSLAASIRASAWFRSFERARLHALPHYGTFVCKDGRYLAIGIVDEDKFWRALCEAIGLSPLAKLPLPARFVSASSLRPLVRAAIARRTRDEWLELLDLDEIPVSPVLHFEEARLDPQLESRRREGATPVIPSPLASRDEGSSPRLGEHTEEVLRCLAPR